MLVFIFGLVHKISYAMISWIWINFKHWICCQSLYQELLRTIPKEHEVGVAEFIIVVDTKL